ncbi:MAG: PilZ domain-containing protein [Desulfatiglandaceae bacterium]
MDIRILLIARDDQKRHLYQAAIRELGVEVKALPSLKGLDADVTERYFHGVVIDMPTKIQALKNDREFIYRTLRKFPVAHLSLEKETGQMRVFYPGQHPGATLHDFVQDQCIPFTPRRLGYHIRKELHYNVLLSKYEKSEKTNIERTVTVDVSEKGCFLFSVQDWEPGDTAWIIIQELDDNTPIQGLVRWSVKWGAGMQIPGIGIKFTQINALQAKEIFDKLWN